ncbi:MAG TPA: alpha/beta hydrolase [Thermoanaerobaculia bacterium]|jgi:pimeloyl-ACP methyl ester carboxylesterase|nr:alpha/beta hydrolase [Thermoanaerobaculia bacterium]
MGRRSAGDRAEPACRLVRFEATEGVALAGLLYEPERTSRRVVIWLHGCGGTFESRRTNLLAEVLGKRGISFFPFNNRGSGVVRRAGNDLGGAAFERIRDCVADIDGAIRDLWRRGYRDITLAGHSTGANKIAVYDHYKPRNRVKRYVLIAGGDDTGLLYAQLGARRFRALLTKAKAMRRSDEIAPRSVSPMLMSWRALYDVANPNGDYNVFPFLEVMNGIRLSRRPLFRYIRAIRKPSLYLYGDRDEFCFGDVPGCMAILARHVNDRAEIVIMRDTGHGFEGGEGELGGLIADLVA